jgi:tetratricopeptide (TPR) repeat protein
LERRIAVASSHILSRITYHRFNVGATRIHLERRLLWRELATAMKSTRNERSAKETALPQEPAPSGNFINRRNLLLGGLLIVATLAVYAQVRGFDFVIIDDALYVGDNEHVRDGVSLENFRGAFTTFRDGNWFPLTWISLMIDASVYGMWPGGYHMTNLALHAVNVLLVFATFSRLTRKVLPSAFVAALFAVHPLHVQSVAWIAERKDVLSMFFGLCALYSYVGYAQRGRARSLLYSVLFFVCSLCSKQTFVTLPFVLLLLDYWPLGRLVLWRNNPSSDTAAVTTQISASSEDRLPSAHPNRGLRRLLIEKIPFFMLSAGFCIVAAVAQSRGEAVLSLDVIPLGARILNALVVYRLYVQKALLPTGLVAYYPHPVSRLGIGDVAVSVVFLLAVTVLAAINARRRQYLIVGWLWYLGTLVPMIGLVQLSGQQMADRYTYLPLLGCYLAIAWLVASLAPRLATRRFVLPAGAAAVVAVYGSVAFVQVSHWHDSISLFRHAVAVGEENPYSLTTFGWALVNAGRFDEAVQPLRRAVKLTPDFGQAQFLLGCVLQKQSKFDEAAVHFRAALTSDEGNAAAHLNLGTILMAGREYVGARREFDRVVELDKNNARAQANLAELCLRLRHYDESIAHAKRGLELDPRQKQCGRLIVIALRDQGRLDEAIDQLRELVAATPEDQASRQELERLLSQRETKLRTATP